MQLLQYFLAIVGEYYDQLPRWQPAQIDGIFGPQTREAVAAYQRLLGLPETGVVDRTTWNELVSTYQSVLAVRPTQEWLAEAVGFPDIFLVEGMRGEAVRRGPAADQRDCARQPAGAHRGGGRHFRQRDAGRGLGHPVAARLPATGAIGPLTWEGMAQLARDVLASAQTSEGQYPGYAVGEGAAI